MCQVYDMVKSTCVLVHVLLNFKRHNKATHNNTSYKLYMQGFRTYGYIRLNLMNDEFVQ